jgi:hypothetical protein
MSEDVAEIRAEVKKCNNKNENKPKNKNMKK